MPPPPPRAAPAAADAAATTTVGATPREATAGARTDQGGGSPTGRPGSGGTATTERPQEESPLSAMLRRMTAEAELLRAERARMRGGR
eukprot:3766076-Pleurochrysis_carterae.AAC.1